MSQDDYEIFKLGDWELQSGEKIVDAHIAFQTFGDHKSPAIVYPTWFSAISDNFWLIGEDKTLNPKEFFIIVPALFGNGQSSSPSNQAKPGPFPRCSFYDNVRAQHELVTKHLGIKHVRAVVGWSMGGAQTYQWATQYPDFMDIAVPFCTSAKTSLHNQVFLEGVKSSLLAVKNTRSAGSGEGGVQEEGLPEVRTWTAKEKEIGLKAMGRVYAGWGFSQAFYRHKLYETALGYRGLEDFMQNFWEKWACSKDPENLLVMMQTWQNGDVSKQAPYDGDFAKAMASIKAKTLVLPGKTDLYFPPEDSEYEVACMKPGVGKLEIFPSIWGHWAGGPGDSKDDVEWLDNQLTRFFAENKPDGMTSLTEKVKDM